MTVQLGEPTDRVPPYKFSAHARVGFSDTDAQGVVYYGRYLPYFDHARVEYHRHLGMVGGEQAGFTEFAMRASHVVYDAPAHFDDLLEVFVRVRRIGTTSVTYALEARRVDDDVLMCTAEQTLVLVDHETRRPAPVPASFRDAVASFEGADLEAAASR
jgi:acyl-CoA thioester hydrolase